MRSISPGASGGRPTSDDRAILDFAALRREGEPDLERYWSRLRGSKSASLLSELIKLDLQARFARGERPRAAAYLAMFPEFIAEKDRVVSIVYEEYCLLEESGERPDPEEFCVAYAPWRDSLESQLGYHRDLSQVAGSPSPTTHYPAIGDQFASYQLESILGKGGAAQVYLATDKGLGDRKVALKLSASFGREPAILANLDHRNIVPILSVTDADASGLRGFCMPYRPGPTLEALIRRMGRVVPPRKARRLWEALNPTEDVDPARPKPDRSGWSGFPVEGTYTEAVAWIGLALANAVSYLHDHGVLHRDIKPANVLLAHQEGPQLLDFNLAHAPNDAEQAHAALRGGTVPYMAPEQLLAFLDPREWDHVGPSADIYALGLVLRELATGQEPDLPNPDLPLPRAIRGLHDRRAAGPIASVRQVNPSVAPALASIIEKCLEFDPADRYESAEDLAEDLRRFLDHRPLERARNPSLVERVANWAYRNRQAAPLLLLALLAVPLRSARWNWPAPTPPPNVAARSVPITDLEEFRRAVEDLSGTNPAIWARAKGVFERLQETHPRSAWPPLCLGLSFEKLGDLPNANKAIDRAQTFGEFKDAVSWGLKRWPQSATLWSTRAMSLFKSNRSEEARTAASKAVKYDPDRAGSLILLGFIERNLKDEPAAIRDLTRGIKFGEGSDYDPAMIFNCRDALIPMQIRWVQEELSRAKSAEDWQAIGTTLDVIDDHIASMQRFRREKPQVPAAECSPFTLEFYRGVNRMERASLAKARGDIPEARRLLAESKYLLDGAKLKIPTNDSAKAIGYQDQLDDKFRELDRRLATLTDP